MNHIIQVIDMKTEIIIELTAALKKEFHQTLISIAVFGSMVKGTLTPTSDIDVIVVCENLPKDWRARDKMVLELTEAIELKYTRPIHMNLLGKEEISMAGDLISPLILEIYDANEIVFDKDDYFKNLLKDMKENLKNLHATKIQHGVWQIPGMAVIESG